MVVGLIRTPGRHRDPKPSTFLLGFIGFTGFTGFIGFRDKVDPHPVIVSVRYNTDDIRVLMGLILKDEFPKKVQTASYPGSKTWKGAFLV